MAKEWGIRALSFLWIGNILPPSFQSNLPHVRPKDYPRAATKSALLLWQQPEQQLLNTVMDLHRLPPLFSRTTTKKNKTLLPSISCLEILLNTCTVCVLKHVEKKGWPWLFEDLTRKKSVKHFGEEKAHHWHRLHIPFIFAKHELFQALLEVLSGKDIWRWSWYREAPWMCTLQILTMSKSRSEERLCRKTSVFSGSKKTDMNQF